MLLSPKVFHLSFVELYQFTAMTFWLDVGIPSLSFKTDLIESKLWFDVEKIEKVIYNLLSNSFKFTKEGGKISISVSRHKVEFPELFSEEYCIAISDTGIGISSKSANKVFTRFYHNGESKIMKGTGIGLHTVKNLVVLLGGFITIESKEGEGSNFKVTIRR